MKIGQKGDYLYVRTEKKRRILKTCLFFLVPIIIITIGVIIFKTKMNLLTIFGVLCCLPACKVLVSLITIWMWKSIDENEYEQINAKAGSLTMVYECILTTYKETNFVDAFAICGNEVIGYSSNKKTDVNYTAEHVEKILHNNGYNVHVKIFDMEKAFLERMDSMNAHADSLREGIRFTPDERYPDLNREELIKHTILAISL